MIRRLGYVMGKLVIATIVLLTILGIIAGIKGIIMLIGFIIQL